MVDIALVISYLAFMLFVGFYYGRNVTTLSDYLVSKREFSDKTMVATLFATVIGAGSTCGVVSNVYASGLIFMFAFYGAVLNKFLVAKFVAPKLKNEGSDISIGDIFSNEYGDIGRVVIGISILFVSVVTLGQQVFAFGLIFEYFFKMNFVSGVLLGFGTLVLYSAFGGIRAVVKTDVIQFIFIIAFIPIVSLIIYDKIDWVNSSVFLQKAFPVNSLDTYSKAFMMFVVMTFTALDPSFLHRLILARDKNQAIYVTKITGYLSLILFTFMGFFGLALSMMDVSIDSAQALPYIVDNFVPTILKGLMISALLATIMSTADSGLHVVSCSVVRDLLIPLSLVKEGKQDLQLRLARVTTLIIGTISVIIAIWFKNIFDIMIFAFGLWAPTGLIPLLFILYRVKITKNQLIVGCFSSCFLTVIWNVSLKTHLYIDGLLPGSLSAFIFFLAVGIYNRKRLNYV